MVASLHSHDTLHANKIVGGDQSPQRSSSVLFTHMKTVTEELRCRPKTKHSALKKQHQSVLQQRWTRASSVLPIKSGGYRSSPPPEYAACPERFATNNFWANFGLYCNFASLPLQMSLKGSSRWSLTGWGAKTIYLAGFWKRNVPGEVLITSVWIIFLMLLFWQIYFLNCEKIKLSCWKYCIATYWEKVYIGVFGRKSNIFMNISVSKVKRHAMMQILGR